MTGVIDLAQFRRPVVYTIEVTHNWDGVIVVDVHGICDDPRSKAEAANALQAAADMAMRNAGGTDEGLAE